VPALAFSIASGGEQLVKGMSTWLRAVWPVTLLTVLLVYGAALQHLAVGLPGLGYGEHMELIPVGWGQLGRQITELQSEIARTTGTEPLVIGMDRYATASELAFYAPDHSRSVDRTSSSHLFGGSGLMYERWFPAAQLAGSTLLLVALEPQKILGAQIDRHITRSDPPHEGVLTRNGQAVHRYYYRVAYGYRP
jgi:dolichol-phosphate mannosyltransferase